MSGKFWNNRKIFLSIPHRPFLVEQVVLLLLVEAHLLKEVEDQ